MIRFMLGASFILCFALAACPAKRANSADAPRVDPDDVTRFYHSLTQPDGTSCCGPGDGYHADDFRINAKGEYVAIVTDRRPDAIMTTWGGIIRRPHIEPGTEFVVPKAIVDHKNPPNISGHTILFVGIGAVDIGEPGTIVYCLIRQAGG